jgi:alkaline phosphatase D
VEVRWEVAEDEAFTRIAARGTETADAADAHSVHAEPAGLLPGRGYWYRFTALGQRSTTGRTRTAPAPDSEATLRFAIASCQRYDMGHYAAWRDVADWAPDLVLFLGDYIYEYPSAPTALRPHLGAYVRTLEDYRQRYAQYRSDPLLQAAHAAAPWLVIWDDHEVDNDYAGLTGQTLQADFADQRAAAYQAWWEHMPVPKAARPVGPDLRLYGRLDWGRLARIHALDGRQHRDLQACPRPGRAGSNTVRLRDCPALADPRRSLLGAAQERWLEAGWDRERPWNLVAQTTLMARMSWSDPLDGGTYWTDGWDGYAPARQRLLDGIAARRLGGTVVLGGDVHAHYVARLLADFDDPLSAVVASEFCGTSISSLSLPQPRIDAALGFNPHILHGNGTQRGSVRFTVDAKSMQAELRAVDDARDAASPVRTAARYVVEAGRPGPVAA